MTWLSWDSGRLVKSLLSGMSWRLSVVPPQERQDAAKQLFRADQRTDTMLIVGKVNSRKTSHLRDIPEINGGPSFWVNSAVCIDVNKDHILHKTAHGDMLVRLPLLNLAYRYLQCRSLEHLLEALRSHRSLALALC